MLRYFNTVTRPDKANEAANQLLCGLFRFVTMLPGPGEKRFKRHIREVSVHQLQFKNNGLQYLLLCKKFFVVLKLRILPRFTNFFLHIVKALIALLSTA